MDSTNDWHTDDGGDDDHIVRKRKREPGEKTLFDTIQVCFAYIETIIDTTLLYLVRLRRAHTLTLSFTRTISTQCLRNP
jgi:hypothetical protein